jgi:hypothetical protein
LWKNFCFRTVLKSFSAVTQAMSLLEAFNKDRALMPQPLPNPPPLAPLPTMLPLPPDARTQEMITEKLKKAEELGMIVHSPPHASPDSMYRSLKLLDVLAWKYTFHKMESILHVFIVTDWEGHLSAGLERVLVYADYGVRFFSSFSPKGLFIHRGVRDGG